jgi:hypothetical protein
MKGCVYKLDCPETGDVYYGSSVCMSKRKSKGWSNNVPETFVIDEPKIIENWEGECITDLRIREQYYIKNYPCVNRIDAHRTKEEVREQRLAEYHRNKLGRRANEKRKEKRFQCEFCKIEMRWDYRIHHWKTSKRCINMRKEMDNINKGVQTTLPFSKGRNKNTCSSQWITQRSPLPNPINAQQIVVV